MSKKFNEIYLESIKNPEKFWQEASNDIFWFKKPTKILNKSNPPFYKWFEDGVTNTCYNALDFHIDQGKGNKTALIYDSPITGNKNKFTYDELRSKVSKFAGARGGGTWRDFRKAHEASNVDGCGPKGGFAKSELPLCTFSSVTSNILKRERERDRQTEK